MRLAERFKQEDYQFIYHICKFRADNFCTYRLYRYGVNDVQQCDGYICPLIDRS